MPCYQNASGQIIENTGAAPCGPDPDNGAATCCTTGSVCLSDGVCGFYGPILPELSGYYIGGCTDPEYRKPGCRSQCGQWSKQDIIWDPRGDNDHAWQCCGLNSSSGLVECANPHGPAIPDTQIRNQFLLVASASISGGASVPFGPAMATAATTTVIMGGAAQASTTNPAATMVTVTSTPNPGSLSPGGIAAIVLGALLALSWVIFAVIILKARRQIRDAPLQSKIPAQAAATPAMVEYYGQSTQAELPAHQRETAKELPGNHVH